MKFLLQLLKGKAPAIAFQRSIPDRIKPDGNMLMVDDALGRITAVRDGKKALYWLGDFVLPENCPGKTEYLKDLVSAFKADKILDVGGFFYAIYIDEKSVTVCNSFAGMLPVFYTETNSRFLVSSDISLIAQHSGKKLKASKRFILEKVLFNYPLSDVSFYEHVYSLPAFHQLQLNDKLKAERYFDISSYFVGRPIGWKKRKNALSDLFISRLEKYIPDQPYCISFTGGFDGRSLLAASNLYKLPDMTYSFGRSNNLDIVIPEQQAEEMQIGYIPFYLDQKHYLEKSLKYGLEFVDTTDGIADFARAHYTYAIADLSKHYKYCITGTMGSEIFRALHVTGSFMSKGTHILFDQDDAEEAFKELFSIDALKNLEMPAFTKEVEELKTFLKQSGYFFTKADKNQSFYRLVFDVMFRGYFGQEIKAFNRYLTNRAPFLDNTFIRELMKTDLSGVYSDYFEHNPLKRFKGQVFYADLIRKSKSPLYTMKTAKGYSPKDLNTLGGKLKIAMNYVQKRNNSPTVKDPFCVREALTLNLENLKKIKIDTSLFNEMKIENDIKELKDTPDLIRVLSMNYWIEKNQKS